MRTQESNPNSSASRIVHQKEAKPIATDARNDFFAVAFLPDGKHVVSGDTGGKIRRWRIEDGKEVGAPMDGGFLQVSCIAVSRDGKWIVSGTWDGLVTVWNAETHSKVSQFRAHHCDHPVYAVDISPDGTKIATGSDDHTACVWSLSTGEQLLGPWAHRDTVGVTKFSPDGRLIATVTCNDSWAVWVYDSQNDSLLVKFPVKVYDLDFDQSIAWANDSKQLFALSHDSYIHHVDVSAKTTLSKWRIHSGLNARRIALASDGTFIATSAGSSVSLWNTMSHKRIGPVIKYTHPVTSMAMSSNYDLVTSGGYSITLRALCGTSPSPSVDNVSNW